MSYKDSFRDPSFRKIKFVWLNSSIEGGNNLQDDGKPKVVKDKQAKDKKKSFIVSDKKKRFTLDGFVKGLNYNIDRDHLMAALEKDGPGELIHPIHGALRVVVESWGLKEGVSEGIGYASFSMTFCEHGRVFIPKQKDDAKEKLKKNSKDSRDLAQKDFANKFDTKGKPQFVKDGAISTFTKIQTSALDNIKKVKSLSVGATDSVFAIRKQISNAKDLIESPISLAANLRGSNDSIRNVSLNPKDLFSAYKNNKEFQKNISPIVPSTTSRAAEKSNQEAFVAYTNTLNATHKSELIIEAFEDDGFDDPSEVIIERNNLIVELEEIMQTTNNDELYIAINAIKIQIIKLVPGEKNSIQNTRKITTRAPTNTLTLAFDLFQNPDKEAEILLKNKIINPLMVLPRTTLEVSSE
jgi:prophage DNA circulation protein